MITWILAVLLLFVAQTMFPSVLLARSMKDFKKHAEYSLGSRDIAPPMPKSGQRALKALNNMKEALPVFVTLALLNEIRGTGETTMAETGAMVFFFARVAYVPAYLSSVPSLRSIIWTVSWVGMGMMTFGLFVYG